MSPITTHEYPRRHVDRTRAHAHTHTGFERYPVRDIDRFVDRMSHDSSRPPARASRGDASTPRAAAPAAIPAPSQAAAPAQTLPHDASTLATLKQIYLMLSPEGRDAFLEWAAQ